MDKIQIIESELISLQYADEQMLDFLVTDLGNRAILVAETFYLEFKYCTQINIDNDLMNTLFLPRFIYSRNTSALIWRLARSFQ